jgi:hypothetical protein
VLSLTYLSSATRKLGADELRELLASVRPKNQALGITGVLLYADGNFVQTLEGPADVVDETYARIAADPRHHEITEAWREEIAERAFPDWSMGFREMTSAETTDVAGFNDYLSTRGRDSGPAGRRFTAEVFHRIFRDGPLRS